MVGKSVCVYNFLHVAQLLLPDPLIFQFPPLVLPSLLRRCREPGWSWTIARRRHQGPRAGGGLAREAALDLEAGPGSPTPWPARPQSLESH